MQSNISKRFFSRTGSFIFPCVVVGLLCFYYLLWPPGFTAANDNLEYVNRNEGMAWHTFAGGEYIDYLKRMVVDNAGNIYMSGYSTGPWGNPRRGYSGPLENKDVFVVKLNSNGHLLWNTFLGSSTPDFCSALAVDANGDVYVGGGSWGTWGAPVNAHSGSCDAFVAKLSPGGDLLWTTFMGSHFEDGLEALEITPNGDIYAVGGSMISWGSPGSEHSGGHYDEFIAKLDANGSLEWNTFLGAAGVYYVIDTASDSSGNLYLTGTSESGWGNPIQGFSGGFDGYVAKFDGEGNRVWNTFMGGAWVDWCKAMTLDGNGNVYVTGIASRSWGAPITPHSQMPYDNFLAKLDNNGNRLWVSFLGDRSFFCDECLDITADSAGHVYVAGIYGVYAGGNYACPVMTFIRKFNGMGVQLWEVDVGVPEERDGEDCSSIGSPRVQLDPTGGYIYLGGHARDIDLGTAPPLAFPHGSQEVFLGKLAIPAVGNDIDVVPPFTKPGLEEMTAK